MGRGVRSNWGQRVVVARVGASRLGDRPGRCATGARAPAAVPPPAPPWLQGLAWRLVRRAGERAGREPAEGDAEPRGHVAHRVEGAIIGHDLEHVAGPRRSQPRASAHRYAEITPVPHAGGGRAVDELGAVTGEQARRLMTDHTPVADGDELRAEAETVNGE